MQTTNTKYKNSEEKKNDFLRQMMVLNKTLVMVILLLNHPLRVVLVGLLEKMLAVELLRVVVYLL